MLHLRIITPKKIVREEDVDSVTAPGKEGEVTILPRHSRFFAMLREGIITFRKKGTEDNSLAIGAGFLETNGKDLNILVSRAYDQDEIDQKQTEKALDDAKQLLAKAKDSKERIDATSLLHRSTIDLKLLKRRKSRY